MGEEGKDLQENNAGGENTTPETSDTTTSSNTEQQKQSSFKEKASKAVQNFLKKGGAAKHSMLAAIAPILGGIFAGLVILIIAIGLIMFFVTMPGMVMEQLKAIFKEAGNFIAAFFGADTTKQVESDEIYATLDYLEQMGYEIKGEGFLTDYLTSEDQLNDEVDTSNGVHVDQEVGVIRNDDDNIIGAESDFIFAYIVSDNYVYTIKNGNIATQNDADNWFEKIITGIATAYYRVYNAIFGPVFDKLGITEATMEQWGSGLLMFYYDNGIGVKGDPVNTATIWNWDAIEIDTDSKKLLITKRSLFNNNNAMEFSLDGWTGRYGMPLEFLLSVHKATQMPDLAYDMATSFNTVINIYLHEIEGTAMTAYKTDSGYVDVTTLQEETAAFEGNNWFSSLINWFDDLIMSDAEIVAAQKLGVDVGTGSGDCTCTFDTVIFDITGQYVLNKSDDGYTYAADVMDGDTVIHKAGDSYSGEIQEVNTITSACDSCRNKLSKIKSYLTNDYDSDFETYLPYIANVTDHWYRDVYFILNRNDPEQNKLEFVDYDYEYEAMMKERWTLYETYSYEEAPDKAGEYKLYQVDENGNLADQPYEGTQEEAEAEGIKLAKKAITIKSTDNEKLTDLGWAPNTDTVWSAYEENEDESSTGYERLYPDEEIEADDEDKAIKEKIYVNLTTTGNIVQTGEGQRTVTNPEIKKMFLQNRYFRYDGSAETAEIITKLRKDNNIEYGPLDEDDLNKTIEVTKDDKTETYTVKDFSANVTLDQDSLNAFSMLENTHTLDADYIYRDFKELIVELGYFTKEELTDETPRLLQFLVPDIGSGGYPNRVIDKREQEYGTMIHSKGDIEANSAHTLTTLYQKISEMEEQNPEVGNAPEEDENVSGITNNTNSQNLSQVSGVQQNSNAESANELTSNSSNVNLNNVKGTSPSFVLERVEESGDGYESVVQSGNVKYIHRYQGGQSYSDIGFLWAGQSNTLGRAACGLFSCFNVLTGYGYDFDPARDLAGFDWGATMDSVKNLMEEKGVTGEFVEYTDTAAVDAALNEGRPVILLFAANAVDKLGVCWTTAGHFVALVGKDSEGNILTLDSAAQGSVERHDYPGTVDDMQPAFQTSPIWIADEPPTGMKQGEGDPYIGYEGNEAVVSPVTGILLEYGTYTDEDIDSVSGEEYRTNVDLKYGPASALPGAEGEDGEEATNNSTGTSENTNTTETPTNGEPQVESETEGGEIVADKVGYAKILVLDAENYQKLESKTGNRWQSDSLVKISEAKTSTNNEAALETDKSSARYLEKLETEEQMDEEHENWNNLDKTIYGYKEFAESYEKYGIAGQIIYIDGFTCELPDESLSGGEEGSGETAEEGETAGGEIAEQIPEGEKLTIDSFKKVTAANLTGTEEPSEEDVLQSKYEKEDEYKLASKKATDKLNAESVVKDEANSSIYLEGEDLIFIKEGTVIGRTMTDREVVEKVRKDPPHPYEYYRPDASTSSTSGGATGDDAAEENEEENEDKLIGNYIRIIMRDLDDTVVENVEDYMKLDEGGEVMEELDDEKFLYWMGIYIEGGNLEQQGDKWISVPVDLSDGAGATHYFGLTHYNLDLAKKLGYNISNWGDNQDLEMLTDVYLALIEEQKAQIKQELGENIEDGYLQAFISILHNYGNLTKRGDEYKATGKVSESTWTTYEGDQYAEALTKRRIGEWILITEGKYMNSYEGNTQEIDFTEGGKYSEETPFTDWCKDHGITNIEVKKADE